MWKNSSRTPIILLTLAVCQLVAIGLAWVSNGLASVDGWFYYFDAALLASVLVWLGYRMVASEEVPGWLVLLGVGAVLLRLGLGAFFHYALPIWGYQNETQQAGYIMFDAFLRDSAAWDLAQSGRPLFEAFRGYTAHDQYGGILFLSALVYRFVGGQTHMPLLVSVFTSAVSGVAVFWVWAFAKRLFDDPVDKWAAWGLALYPEVVMLGGAQMREAFTVTFGIGLAYLLHRWWVERKLSDLLLFVLLAAITAAFSWTYLVLAGVVLGLLLLSFVFEKKSLADFSRPQLAWLGVGGAVFLTAVLYFSSVLIKMNQFQETLTETTSGVVQHVLDRLPEFLHTPFIVSYGVTRPLLPPAFFGMGGSELWWGVAVWRALGWTVVLALLLYATVLTIRKHAWLSTTSMLLLGNWGMILLASYRAGGDMWDNPRYRAGFAAFQIVMAAWALAKNRELRDPWLGRIAVSAGIIFVWVMVWYIPRYFSSLWENGRIEDAVGLGIFSAVLYMFTDWLVRTPPEG